MLDLSPEDSVRLTFIVIALLGLWLMCRRPQVKQELRSRGQMILKKVGVVNVRMMYNPLYFSADLILTFGMELGEETKVPFYSVGIIYDSCGGFRLVGGETDYLLRRLRKEGFFFGRKIADEFGLLQEVQEAVQAELETFTQTHSRGTYAK